MKQYDQISSDTLKEILKIWRAKNTEELISKTSDKNIVAVKFFKLSEEAKKIIFYLIQNKDKELYSIDIAYALKYAQKQLNAFSEYVQEIKRSGLIYLKMKRRRLNSNDDTLYLLPGVYDTIKKNIIEENEKIKDVFEENYNLSVYKKYEKKIILIYENALPLTLAELNLREEEVEALCKANIINLYFNKKNGVYAVLNNVKVISNIEKTINERVDSSALKYNHANILNDIDNFIYEANIQRFRIENLNESINIITENMTPETIALICIKLDLIKIDNKNYIILDNKNIKSFLSKNIEDRKKEIINSVYKEYRVFFDKILDFLSKNKTYVSKAKLFFYLKEKYRIELIPKTLEDMLCIMFSLGLIKAVFYEEKVIALKDMNTNGENKKCIINGNFELTLINASGFPNDFIYMCNLYFSLEKQDSVYTYSINEETILKGKTLSLEKSQYSFKNLIETLKSTLNESETSMPKHIETSMTRWYERIILSSIYENITLINVKNSNKLEELIHEAKRKNIEIIKINEEYAIIKSDISKRSLIKFLRQKRIIVTYN